MNRIPQVTSLDETLKAFVVEVNGICFGEIIYCNKHQERQILRIADGQVIHHEAFYPNGTFRAYPTGFIDGYQEGIQRLMPQLRVEVEKQPNAKQYNTVFGSWLLL